MERLPHAQRNPYLFISGISGYILLAAFVNIFPPDSLLWIGLFVVALSISTGLLIQYLFQRPRQSILLTLGLAVFLALRFFGLRSPIYTTLLIACIVSLELTMRKR